MPSYNIHSVTSALGYNLNDDQIEFSLTSTQAQSPINETNSTLSFGYEKSLGNYKDFSSTIKISISKEFNSGNSSNSYSLEPKLIYDANGFQPFISASYSRDFNGGSIAKEYSVGFKVDTFESLSLQPSFFYSKDGSEKSNGVRLELVKSFK